MNTERDTPTRIGFIPEIKSINAKKRQVTHLISNDSVDRAGDIIDPQGWTLENYKRNPIVLLNHSYDVRDIIGKSVAIDTSKEGLYSTTEFGQHMVGEEAFLLVQAGLAKAWSVGFAPVKGHTMVRGASDEIECPVCMALKPKNSWATHFTAADLLEYSLVAIPMNQDVVMDAVKAGLTKAHVPLFFRNTEPETPSLDARHGANVPRDRAAVMREVVKRLRRHRCAAALRDVARNL